MASLQEKREKKAAYMRAYNKKRRSTNPDLVRERRRIYNQKQYAKRKEFLAYARRMLEDPKTPSP